MKKILAAMVMLAVMIPVVAWAGERRSDLIDEIELAEIEAIAQKAYPRDAKVVMEVLGDDWLGACTIVQFTTKNDRQALQVEIYPLSAYAKISGVGGVKIGETAGRIIAKKVGEIFNKRPAQVIEQLF